MRTAVFVLLMPDHLLHALGAVVMAGVLHAVRRDNENRVIGNILFSRIAMDADNVMNCPADCIQKRGAAAGSVIFACHRADCADCRSVILRILYLLVITSLALLLVIAIMMIVENAVGYLPMRR